MRMSHQLVPKGGWVYHQGKVALVGGTWDALVSNVKQHRAINGIPRGNIEEDIENQMIVANPSLECKQCEVTIKK